MNTMQAPDKHDHPLSGIHAATLCPLDNAGEVLESELSHHVGRVAMTPGIRGLLINGHAGEGSLLSVDERRRVLQIVRSSVPDSCHVCAGVAGESTAVAVASAIDAARQGADSILVFPPNAWALGHDSEMALIHHQSIAAACDLPMVLYRAPLAAGRQSYAIETLMALIDIQAVVAIKEGSWEVSAYEEARLAVQSVRSEVAVLGSGDEHLMTCYSIGTEGSQVSLAAIVPSLIVELFDAMQVGDLFRARELHALVYPLSLSIYRQEPAYRATARLKACLHLMGQFSTNHVKSPTTGCGVEETTSLRKLLERPDYADYLLR